MLSLEDAGLDDDFKDLALEIISLNKQKNEIEKALEDKKILARAYMEDYDDSASWSARGEGWSVSYIKPGPKETLVKELLIQQGVTMKQIAKATKTTPSSPYVQFRATKERT